MSASALTRLVADLSDIPIVTHPKIVRVAAACARHRVPVTVRAGGTGNYGQAVPLQGGVLLDITALAAIEWVKPGMMRVGVGAKMNAIDAELQPQGWELRMHPSTK